MAVDAFLKLDDLKGESTDDAHKGEMEILAWSWGMSQMGTTHHGTGGGAGKANVSDITITKHVDTASPNLLLACCSGKHFEEAVLTMRKAGETPLDYFVIKMKDIIITSVSVSGSSGGDLVTETVSLNFAIFNVSYQPQDKKGGKAGGAVEAGWDIAKNVKV